MPALAVAVGEAPSAFIPAGPFRAKFTGYLKLPLRGTYEFSLAGRGAVELAFNGEPVMSVPQGDLSTAKPATANLAKGFNKLELTYTSLPDGEASLRLLWAHDEFPAEPVSAALWSFDGRDADWQHGTAQRLGRQLFAERHCIACHTLPDGVVEQIAKSPQAMPELSAAAPSLIAAGQRFDASWLRQWMFDPASLRNRTTMPQTLAHLDAKAQSQHAADIAAFLLAQKDDAFKPLAADAGDGRASGSDELVAQGAALFEDRGCIACHRFTPPGDADEFNRVSLHYVGQKYQAGALAAFLSDSHRYYAWNRMPKFALDAAEAAALAAFLRRNSEGRLPPQAAAPAASADRGRALFAEVGCANCHAVSKGDDAKAVPRERIAMADLAHGCLADRDGNAKFAPRFATSDAEREARRARCSKPISHR